MGKKQSTHVAALPFHKLFPSIITIAGICVGLFAFKAGLAGHWEHAVMLLLVAGIIDGIDGKIARLLNAATPFGAQLDSLADFLNFGVVPAILIYSWKTKDIKAIGWAVALFFIVCQAIRLARFNAKMFVEPEVPELKNKFFEGVAAPMGAALSLVPMMLTFLFNDKFEQAPFEITPLLVIIYISFIAVLMVSRIPTFSLKGVNIKRQHATVFLALTAFLIIAAITEPWITFSAIGMIYLLSIPWCYHRYYRIKQAHFQAKMQKN